MILHSPSIEGVIRRVLYIHTQMEIITTLTKQIDDRKSTWRFVKTPEGYCAIGGNYKLVSYRSKSAMDRSIKWFTDKGFTIA